MKRLRVPPLEEKQSPMVTFRIGIFIGINCVLLPMVIILIVVLNKSQLGNPLAWREALHLYRSSFLIILQIILAGINVYDRQWWSTNLTSPASPKGIFCTGWTRFLLQAFLLALPSSLRFIQCIRRYHDTKLKFPHLVNAGKYAKMNI
ncbi:unnamed protein product [Rotaria sordida]|uniref:EXS domain-containing protein n=1 Tax=Rotaria sordida TaxID=392033 RepID=A0A819TWR3_9BILA|nr:unnamed protein product [Rotaria sordida]